MERRKRKVTSLSLTALVLLWALIQPTLAQQTVTSATLGGRVRDGSGSFVNGASLIATNQQTNQSLTAVTDDQGRYRFPYLQVGEYKVSVEARGFAPWTKLLTV